MRGESQWQRDGVVVGLVASVTVAVFYGTFDVLASRGIFFTVSLLGRALFQGLRDPSVLQFPMAPDYTAVVLYSALHVVASLAIGLIVVGLVGEAERSPGRARLIVGAIISGFVVTIAAMSVLTAPMRGLLPIWSIALANGLATLCAGGYLLTKRPGLWARLMR